MPNQQKLEQFWNKLLRSTAEVQHDFADLDAHDKQVIMDRINSVLKMQGIAIGIDSLIGIMENLRTQRNQWNSF